MCFLLVAIIFVFGNTKLEGTQRDISSVITTERSSSSVCNGTVGECGTGDEVELLLTDIPRSRLLVQAQKKPYIITDALKSNQKGCYRKCVKQNNPGIPNRLCARCDYYAAKE